MCVKDVKSFKSPVQAPPCVPGPPSGPNPAGSDSLTAAASAASRHRMRRCYVDSFKCATSVLNILLKICSFFGSISQNKEKE